MNPPLRPGASLNSCVTRPRRDRGPNRQSQDRARGASRCGTPHSMSRDRHYKTLGEAHRHRRQ